MVRGPRSAKPPGRPGARWPPSTLVAAGCSQPTATARRPSRNPTRPPAVPGCRLPRPATGLVGPGDDTRVDIGPSGVVSSAIVAENKRPGDQRPGGSRTRERVDRRVRGPQLRRRRGHRAPVRVDHRPHVHGRRLPDGLVPGHRRAPRVVVGPDRRPRQPPCRFTRPSTSWLRQLDRSTYRAVTPAFVQGDYLFKLVGRGNQQAYVPLTVWDPSSHATYLIMNRRSPRRGGTPSAASPTTRARARAPSTRPPTRCATGRAWSPSTGPTTPGRARSDFLGDEYPLIRYCEEQGLDVTYVHRHHRRRAPRVRRQPPGAALARPRRVVVLQRAAGGLERAERHGRQRRSSSAPRRSCDTSGSSPRRSGPTAWRSTTATRARTRSTAKRSAMEVTGNTWAPRRRAGPPSTFVGERLQRVPRAGRTVGAVRRSRRPAWVFRGHRAADGYRAPPRRRADIDHVDEYPGCRQPTVLGHSPIPLSKAYTNQGTWGGGHVLGHDLLHEPHQPGRPVRQRRQRLGRTRSSPARPRTRAARAPTPARSPATCSGCSVRARRGPVVPSTPNWTTVNPSGS